MLSVRQHWMALIRPGAIMMIVLGLGLLWTAANPKVIVGLLHLTRQSPEFNLIHGYYDHPYIFVIIPFIIALFQILMAWSWWSISYFQVDNYALTYKMGPFISNTIPLRAIQDIRKTRGILGVIFGFGTIIVDSGREEEALLYVPEIDNFMDNMRPKGLY